MKDITTPVPQDDMRNLLRTYLEKAAHINYGQLLEFAQVKGQQGEAAPCPETRLEEVARLGELVIEVLQQNDEHHAEVSRRAG